MSINSYITKPNTDISAIQFETRNCVGCGLPMKVATGSKHTHHSLNCAELPRPESWKRLKDDQKLADHFHSENNKRKKPQKVKENYRSAIRS